MLKRRRCAKSSTLRKRRGTERGSLTANTWHQRQRSWSPVLDLVVIDAQESGHWFFKKRLEIKALQFIRTVDQDYFDA